MIFGDSQHTSRWTQCQKTQILQKRLATANLTHTWWYNIIIIIIFPVFIASTSSAALLFSAERAAHLMEQSKEELRMRLPSLEKLTQVTPLEWARSNLRRHSPLCIFHTCTHTHTHAHAHAHCTSSSWFPNTSTVAVDEANLINITFCSYSDLWQNKRSE